MKYAENVYFLDENGDIEHNEKKYSMLKEVLIPKYILRLSGLGAKSVDYKIQMFPKKKTRSLKEISKGQCILIVRPSDHIYI